MVQGQFDVDLYIYRNWNVQRIQFRTLLSFFSLRHGTFTAAAPSTVIRSRPVPALVRWREAAAAAAGWEKFGHLPPSPWLLRRGPPGRRTRARTRSSALAGLPEEPILLYTLPFRYVRSPNAQLRIPRAYDAPSLVLSRQYHTCAVPVRSSRTTIVPSPSLFFFIIFIIFYYSFCRSSPSPGIVSTDYRLTRAEDTK